MSLLEALFNGWSGIVRVLVIAPAAYLALIIILRMSGKRTLAKLNAFDLVVTVSIGSTLAAIIINKSVALVEGLAALTMLVVMQFAVSALALRFPVINRAVKSQTSLLLRHGELLPDAMRRQRIGRDDIEAAVREAGSRSLDEAEAVFLETDGSLSVVLRRP